MEILKFDEAGSSSPSRKRSGRGAILVTFVALVFGAGTALASGTLAINTNNEIALDQGVANSVQCDSSIGVVLNAPYDTVEEDFLLNGLSITGIDNSVGNCLGKWFKVKIYDSNGDESIFCDATADVSNGCIESGKAAKLQVSLDHLDFTFTQGMKTGEPDPSSSATPRPRLVRVKNVTVESSDS
jgi:hypothetical protein